MKKFTFARANQANAFLTKLAAFGIKACFQPFSDGYTIAVSSRDALLAQALY